MDFICLFCHLNCHDINGTLTHLRLFHFRFTYELVPGSPHRIMMDKKQEVTDDARRRTVGLRKCQPWTTIMMKPLGPEPEGLQELTRDERVDGPNDTLELSGLDWSDFRAPIVFSDSDD